MKPRSAIEKRVELLSKTLPQLDEKHYVQAIEKCFVHEAWKSGNSCYCTMCGKELFDSGYKIVCPHCGRELLVVKTRKKNSKDTSIFVVITTCKEFQVVRYIEAKRFIKLNWIRDNRVMFQTIEVCRFWVNPQGDSVWQAKSLGFNFYCRTWRYDTDITIKRNRTYDMYCKGIYTPQRVIPQLKMNGYNLNLYEESPASCFKWLLKSKSYETLWKAGYHKFLASISNLSNIERNWDALKICIRNKYIPEEPNMWFDMMSNLREMGMDTKNPKLVCPADLHEAHDKYIKQVVSYREKKRMKEDMELFNKKEPFFGICFGNGKIKISVLSSIKEYKDEALAMRNCVYSNRYYAKSGSICMSAKDSNGNRLATVELSLNDYEVVQCFAKGNKVTKWRDQIIKLVKSHEREFRKANEIMKAS